MLNFERRLALVATVAAFILLAFGSGCKGFFVNQPNSIAVTPSTLSVAVGATGQLTATASFDSGSKIVTNSASWQSSSSCATVSNGVVKGVGPATSVTITATLAGVSGTSTVTVTGGTAQTLTITAPTIVASGTGQFTATLNNSDVTSSSTWTSDNTSAVTFSSTVPGEATFGTSGQTANVTASLAQGTTCASGTLAVTIP